MKRSASDEIRHMFHVVSNVRPIVWICLYIVLTPLFALAYWALPDGQFRMPDGAGTGFGSWLYYSIVTITTLGFGDYTPAHGWAQAVTAVEVMCGLIILGFFLNAVGSMKSEIDVDAEIEKQRRLHEAAETNKLTNSIPSLLHTINTFLAYCYAVTTPLDRRTDIETRYNPDFTFADMADMFHRSGLPFDRTRRPAVDGLIRSAFRTSLALDSLQTRIDLELWPELLEYCFTFVANSQMFASADNLTARVDGTDSKGIEISSKAEESRIADMIRKQTAVPDTKGDETLGPAVELYYFIKENGALARKIETALTKIGSATAS